MGLRSAVMSFLHCMVPCDEARLPALPAATTIASTSSTKANDSSIVRPFPRSGRIPESPILSPPRPHTITSNSTASTLPAFRPPRSRLFAPKCIYNVNEPA